MSASTRSLHIRLLVISCLLSALLVIHVSLRYLAGTLFGFVTYRGLAPLVPFLILGLYMLLVGGLAVVAGVRYGNTGLVMGTGLLILAVEPVVSSYLWGDGCEVSSTAGASLVPEIMVSPSRMVVVLHPWNGACSTSLTIALLGLGVAFLVSGLWMERLPDVVLSEWMTFIERCWPSKMSEYQ